MTILIFFTVLFIYWIIEPSIDSVLYSALCAGTSGDNTAIIIYGLIKAVLGIAVYYLAFRLAVKWSKHRKNGTTSKIAPAESASPAESEVIAEPEPPAPQPQPTPAPLKLRFCKLCGNPIDPTTHKCTDCGKQYFRPPVLRKKHLAFTAAVLVCAAVALLIFSLISKLNATETKVDALNAQITELNAELNTQKDLVSKYTQAASSYSSSLNDLQKKYDALRKENSIYREYLDYCEYYCAYINRSGSDASARIYHRLDCPYVGDTGELTIIYIDYLNSRGFTPCPHCYG